MPVYDPNNERSTLTIGEVDALRNRLLYAEMKLREHRRPLSPLDASELAKLRDIIVELLDAYTPEQSAIRKRAEATLLELTTDLYSQRPRRIGPIAHLFQSMAMSGMMKVMAKRLGGIVYISAADLVATETATLTIDSNVQADTVIDKSMMVTIAVTE